MVIKVETDRAVQEDIEDFLQYLRVGDTAKKRHTSRNTVLAYRNDVEQFAAYLHQQGFNSWDVTPLDLVNYKRDLDNRYAKASTRARKIASVRALYRFLHQEQRIQRDPAKMLQLPTPVRRGPEIITVEQLEHLVAAAKVDPEAVGGERAKQQRDFAMLLLLSSAGLLASEVVALDVEDVTPTAVHVRSANRGRTVALEPAIADILAEYIHVSRPFIVISLEECALFVNARGGRLTRQGFWLIIKHYAHKAGLDSVSPRLLRHSCAAQKLQEGAELTNVQRLLGHAHMSSTRAYVHPRLIETGEAGSGA
ncbi:MAG: tyrosine-type recombinase/integrase [Chloroflexi bacterium]|nr:tyrosine-type recombinase/integrase [Chloroflexota bacterium]